MLSKKILKELELFIGFSINPPILSEDKSLEYMEMDICESIRHDELESFIDNNRDSSFSQVLLDFIDEKSLRDSDVYKKANIDRRHFSKIRSNPGYHTSKKTVIALALALELNKKETYKLLNSAGYSLSDYDTFDLVIQFCLDKNIYDLQDVNLALYYFSLKPLGIVLE